MNLEGYTPGTVADDELLVEDRWILSRLATVTEQVTEALDEYQLRRRGPDAVRFRLGRVLQLLRRDGQGPLAGRSAARPAAQRVLAHTLDALLRLLHPMIPFLTEEVWQLLGELAPERGIDRAAAGGRKRDDRPLAGVRPGAAGPGDRGPVRPVPGGAACGPRHPQPAERAAQDARSSSRSAASADVAELLEPMEPYFTSMAGATAGRFGPDVGHAAAKRDAALSSVEVFVDLAGLIDPEAELVRNRQERERLTGLIAAKEKEALQRELRRARPGRGGAKGTRQPQGPARSTGGGRGGDRAADHPIKPRPLVAPWRIATDGRTDRNGLWYSVF